ncbi:hypothetical protein CCYN2B_140085 [Capnocytophaga cynodegmi]|uniref:Dilute domain-containing protein n=1 Tax=Capnocytophaga cynodegmi TaxID=28189 RepID=A0A0B7H6D4_9FLAO|nr:hypothetical protein CCYN2B_140085 [Capnocytophaga cynodegmi]
MHIKVNNYLNRDIFKKIKTLIFNNLFSKNKKKVFFFKKNLQIYKNVLPLQPQ